ncbi:MAG TPA: hypothetical protein IAA30_08220 [Candidatus Treponema faecavium]|nr:hypothetical protein [Candidatus Treponema faecavium]
MVAQELFDRSPVRLFDNLTGGLKAGEIGLITAKKGLGKTSVLVQFGVDALLKDEQIVHVSFDQQSANVITWYTDIFDEIAKKRNVSNISDIKQELVRKRIILNFNQDTVSLNQIAATLRALAEGGIKAQFMTVDGMDFTRVSAQDLQTFIEFARSCGMQVWFSENCESDKLADTLPADMLCMFDCIMHLDPKPDQIQVRILKLRDGKAPEAVLRLDSKTLLMTDK